MTITIQVRKARKAYEFDFVDLPENVREFVIDYGLRQIMNDSVSSAKTESEALGMADKKFDALLSGALRATREAKAADPVAARAKEIAEDLVRKSQGWAKFRANTESKDARKAWFAAKVAEVAAMDRVRTQAELDVAAIAELDIDF